MLRRAGLTGIELQHNVSANSGFRYCLIIYLYVLLILLLFYLAINTPTTEAYSLISLEVHWPLLCSFACVRKWSLFTQCVSRYLYNVYLILSTGCTSCFQRPMEAT